MMTATAIRLRQRLSDAYLERVAREIQRNVINPLWDRVLERSLSPFPTGSTLSRIWMLERKRHFPEINDGGMMRMRMVNDRLVTTYITENEMRL